VRHCVTHGYPSYNPATVACTVRIGAAPVGYMGIYLSGLGGVTEKTPKEGCEGVIVKGGRGSDLSRFDGCPCPTLTVSGVRYVREA